MHTIHDFCIRFINQITKILNIVLNRIALFFLSFLLDNILLLSFFLLGHIQLLSFFIGLHPTGCFFSFSLGCIQLFLFFVGLHPTVFVCYFWLDPKVTKRSRLNRPGYSGRRLRCRLRNSLRSNSAGSGRYAFTLRFTPVRLGLSQKAELSLMIADTACFSFLFPFSTFPFASPFLFLYISLLFPCISLFISLYLPFASPPRRGRALLCPPAKSPTPFRPST